MPKRERWLRPVKAARLVARRCGLSIGASRPILRDAMSSDKVRVQSVADPKNPEYLPAEIWGDAQFDLERNVVTGADRWALEQGLNGKCQYHAVEISGDDLEDWLNANSTPAVEEPSKNPAARSVGRVAIGEYAPGPKGGEQSIGKKAWKIAEAILASDKRRPKPGHGRLTALAGMVNAELARDGIRRKDDSIRKAIGKSLREWESKNRDK